MKEIKIKNKNEKKKKINKQFWFIYFLREHIVKNSFF